MTRIIAVLFTLLVAFGASAQVVQPVYVRPSKSSAYPALANKGVGTHLSSVIDMTAFTGLQYVVTSSSPASGCEVNVTVKGALTKDATTFIQNSGYNNSIQVFSPFPALVTVPSVMPFVKIEMIIGGAGCGDTFTLAVVGDPFPSTVNVAGTSREGYPGVQYSSTVSGIDRTTANPGPAANTARSVGVDSIGSVFTRPASALSNFDPVTVSGVAAWTLVYTNQNRAPVTMTVQNVGTTAVGCAFTSGGSPSSSLAFILKAGSVANDGTGGDRAFNMNRYTSANGATTEVYCHSLAVGTGTILYTLE